MSRYNTDVVLHELGHAAGDLLNIDRDPRVEVAYHRLYAKLNPYSKTSQQEFFADAVACYLTDNSKRFDSRYDTELRRLMKELLA